MSILRSLSPWSFPSIAVLVFLAGCSPSSPEPGAGQAAGKQEALCKHEVAEKFCPLCHPEVLKDPNILLCKEHGNIPEDVCTACHPELKAKYKTCEHELPPALCTTCQKKGAPSGGSK
jgi:cobalt-zinc-cadmium efflux system membrane fusion protein